MIRVYPFGKYQNRQPMAYAAIRAACDGRISVTDQMDQAALVIITHTKDLAAHGAWLHKTLQPGQRLVLLSEEPFWDTVWGHDPFARRQTHLTTAGPLPVTVLNHATSVLYDFARIPYFLLTDPSYQAHYARRFQRNAALGPDAWRGVFRSRQDIHFLAERRDDSRFDVTFPGTDVFGLGAWRTRLALACTGAHVIRNGHGWPGHGPIRQTLPYWHMDKLQMLDGQCRILSAIENTHQANYISEKLFDAFALGAIPLYVAGPTHLSHELVPDSAWLNLYGLDTAEAAARIMAFQPDTDFLTAYAAAQRRLAGIFCHPANTQMELHRLADALVAEFRAVLQDLDPVTRQANADQGAS